jgi:hypothetical protein
MERTSLRSLWVTVVAMGLFVYLPLGMFPQDAGAIESQEFRKMAKKTADLEPWAWGPLFNDAVSEPDSRLQLGKMIELLKYSGGRDYACAHALELIKRIQHEPARHEVMNLFFYAQGDLPNKFCGARKCQDEAETFMAYIISMSERPSSEAKVDKREFLALDSMELLSNYFECTSEWRYLTALISLLHQQRLDKDQASLTLNAITQALKVHPGLPQERAQAKEMLQKVGTPDISPELSSALQCAIQGLQKPN